MYTRHMLASAVILFFLTQIAGATTTVTLTGTCPTSIINQSSNYLLFNLSNSGNGAATDLMLIPTLDGATTPNETVTIPLIAPGSSYSTKFYLYNFTEPGSYAEYITAKYSQGSSTFVTIFPCLVNILKNAPSFVQITNMSHTGSRLSVTAINLAKYPIDTNVIMHVPPTFNIVPEIISVHINPNSKSTAVFNLSLPNYTNAQFPIVAAISYANSSIHYATLGFDVISFAAQATASSVTSTVNIIVVAAIATLLVLILISSVKKGKPKQRAKPQDSPMPVAEAQKLETVRVAR